MKNVMKIFSFLEAQLLLVITYRLKQFQFYKKFLNQKIHVSIILDNLGFILNKKIIIY